MFIEALRYYRANRGKGSAALDVSRFFRDRKGHDREFHKFWQGARTAKFDRLLGRIRQAIDEFEE